MNDIILKGYAPNVVGTAMELRFFSALVEGPTDAGSLAAKLGTERPMEAFADALAALKLLDKSGVDYSLGRVAADFLVKSSPAYQGRMIAMSCHYDQVMIQVPLIPRNGPAKFDTDMWANAEATKDMGQGAMGRQIHDMT